MKAPKRSKRQNIDSDHEEENQLRTFLKIVPEEKEKINYEVLGTRMDLGDLRIMFESKEEDELWKNQEEWKLQSWIFYENCGVYVLRLEDVVFDDDTVFDLLKFIEQQINKFGVQDGKGKLKENQGCRVDTDQVHQNGDLKNRSVWIHPPGLQDVYTKET
ncbi:hypothetical protein Tco_0216724 [Tanacetum coccineum]